MNCNHPKEHRLGIMCCQCDQEVHKSKLKKTNCIECGKEIYLVDKRIKKCPQCNPGKANPGKEKRPKRQKLIEVRISDLIKPMYEEI